MSRRSTITIKKISFIKFWENILHKKKYIVNSNNLRNQLLSDEGVDKSKIIEIKNGIKEISFERKDSTYIKKKYKAKADFQKIM